MGGGLSVIWRLGRSCIGMPKVELQSRVYPHCTNMAFKCTLRSVVIPAALRVCCAWGAASCAASSGCAPTCATGLAPSWPMTWASVSPLLALEVATCALNADCGMASVLIVTIGACDCMSHVCPI